MRHRVRAVDDRDDAARARHARQVLHREDLPGQVGDVAEVQHLGARRDRAFEPRKQLLARRRHREIDLGDLDLVAARALVPRRQHAAVILLGGHDLVAGLEVEAVLRDLQRLARVARDRHFLGVAAELRGQPAADHFDVPLDQPAVIHRRLVRVVEIALVRLVHDRRARAAVAVVQVDQRAVQRERVLDVTPVAFVGGHVVRRAVAERARRLRHQLDAVVAEGKSARAQGAGHPQKRASIGLHLVSSRIAGIIGLLQPRFRVHGSRFRVHEVHGSLRSLRQEACPERAARGPTACVSRVEGSRIRRMRTILSRHHRRAWPPRFPAPRRRRSISP